MIHTLTRRPFVALLTCAGLLGLIAVTAGFGPLNPPAGAVTGTAKPLSEVEPRIAVNATNTPGDGDSLFRITAPGSYYLTGNITGVAGKNGIELASSGITLDLNGFDLKGVTGSLGGVTVTVASLVNLAVVNGSVRDWDGRGVDLGTTSSHARVEGVVATGNGTGGIRVSSNSTVSRCTGARSGGIGGITVGLGCTIANCVASDNTGQSGFTAGTGATITGCVAMQNANNGFTFGNQSTICNSTASNNGSIGISLGNDCTVDTCTADANGTGIFSNSHGTILNSTISASTSGAGVTTPNEGLRVQGCTISSNATFGVFSDTSSNISNATIASCSIHSNGSGGVSAESSTQVLACNVNDNGLIVASPGIRVADGSSVIDSTSSKNNGGGIVAGAGTTISRCTVYENTGNGISVGGSSTVLDSTARLNTVDGFLFTFRCQVRGNNAGSNGLSQFHATNTDNRIESNTAVSGSIGFDIDVAGNIITRNSATNAGTNWDIVAGNVALVVNATTAPAISGNAGGVAPGSTDPNANFTY